MHSHLEHNMRSQLLDRRHGFIPCRSSTDAINLVCPYFGRQGDIYPNFSSVFDRLDRNVLLFKLSDFELFPSLLMFFFMLLNRKEQYVEHRGCNFSASKVTSGAPSALSSRPYSSSVQSVVFYHLLIT